MGNHYALRRLSAQQRERLESGKPVFMVGGVKIIKNKETGEYEGVPKEWVDNYDLPIKINLNKLIKTKNLPEQIRPDYDLPDSIITLINSQPQTYQISSPLDFKHNLHLQVDMTKPMGIKNLPEQWIQKLQASKIDRQDIISDPSSTIKIISSYDKQLSQSKVESLLITTEEFQKMVDNVVFLEENPASRFIFSRQLGKGAVCKVFEAYDRQEDNRKYYACRIIKVRQQGMLRKIKTEIAVMKMCSSPSIETYYFTYYFKQSLFMFVEFMNGGSLTDFIYHYCKKIPQNVISYILKEVLIGLVSLHSKRQLHRDLKSDNLLFNTNGEIKIADFGFAIQLTKDKMNRKSIVGTPAWMAPQLVQKQDYDEKVDIWSLGMVLFELFDGEPPYLRLPHLKAMHCIVTKPPPKPKGVSAEIQDFVGRCLQINPKDRYSSKQLLEHPLIKKSQKGKQTFVQMIKQMKSEFPF